MLNVVPTAVKVPPLRTFASDLAHAREGGVLSIPTKTKPIPIIPKTLTHNPVTLTPVKSKVSVLVDTISVTDSAIPPFHTFNKTAVKKLNPASTVSVIDTSDVKTPRADFKTSVLASTSIGLGVGDDDESDSQAIVITDTKRNRFSLIGALSKSISTWFKGTKDTLTTPVKPKYTLPEADRRKGIIQRATSQTGRMTTADHAEVLKKLRSSRTTLQPAQVSTEVTILKTPSWETATPNRTVIPEIILPPKLPPIVTLPRIAPIIPVIVTIPVVLPMQREPIIQPVDTTSLNNELISIDTKELEIQLADTAVSTKDELSSIDITEPKITHTVFRETIPIQVTPFSRPKIVPLVPNTLSAPYRLTPLNEMDSVSTLLLDQDEVDTLPEIESSVRASLLISNREPLRPGAIINTPIILPPAQLISLTSFWSTRLVVLFSIIGIGLLVLSGTGYVIFTSISSPTPELAVPIVTNSFDATLRVTSEVTSKADIVAAYKNYQTDSESLTEIFLLSNRTRGQLTGDEFFTYFEISLPVAFTAAVNQLRTGTYRGQPWLLFSISDTPTGQGGMFIWEKRMANDLQLLFTGTNRLSRSTQSTFTDTIIDNRDVRTVKDSTGTSQLTYGFITPNSILITGTDTAWLNLNQKLNDAF